MTEREGVKRKQLLLKLPTINHLNVTERKALGGSPTFMEMLEAASIYFQTSFFLPAVISAWNDNQLCYEGYSLKKSDQLYILHHQIAGPALNLYASEHRLFISLKDALSAFLQNEFNFSIDGIQITH